MAAMGGKDEVVALPNGPERIKTIREELSSAKNSRTVIGQLAVTSTSTKEPWEDKGQQYME